MTITPPTVTACDGCQALSEARQDRDKARLHLLAELRDCCTAIGMLLPPTPDELLQPGAVATAVDATMRHLRGEADSLRRQIELHSGDIASEEDARKAAEERAEEAGAEAEVLRRRFEGRTRVARWLVRVVLKRTTENATLRAQLAEIDAEREQHGAHAGCRANERLQAAEIAEARADRDRYASDAALARELLDEATERLATAREEGRREGLREAAREAAERVVAPDILALVGHLHVLAEKGGGR